MALPEVLHRLLSAHGPSGYETAAAAVWREAATDWATSVDVDTMGTSTATVAGTQEGALRVAVVGHIDEIGLIVTHLDDKGFAYFTGVGGWDPQILVGQRVVLSAAAGPLPGVIGKKPIHLLKEEERKKVAELKDLHIDFGYSDGEDLRAHVRVGDVAVLAGEPVELPNGRAVSKSMDNRLGAFVAFEAARLVAEQGAAAGDVIAVAAVQEEIGLYGARAAAYSLHPDVAIVVDVTHATDAPGIDVKEEGEHPFGSGPVIQRGSTLHPRVFELLVEAAEQEGVAHTLAASAGRTGTDADAMHFTRGGIPTAVVSIPLRYMHSPVEMVQLSDVLDAARVIAAFCRRLAPDQDLTRR